MSIFDRFKKAAKQSDKSRGLMVLPWESGREWVKPDDMASQIRAYQSWVYIAANKNATAFASVPLRLYAAKKSAGQKLLVPTKHIGPQRVGMLQRRAGLVPWTTKAAEVVEVQEHPFLDLMKRVNDFTNSWQLLFDTDLFQELTGNSYWYVVRDNLGLPAAIWSLPSQFMSIVASSAQYIQGYVFKRGSVEVAFTPEEIVHFKLPNPGNFFYGMSPLQAAKDAYNIQANMNIYSNAIFSNDGRLAGAFETDAVLNDTTFTRLKETIRENFRGAKNAGKIPLLEAGLHYKEYSLAPKDLDFLNGRRWTQEEIVNAYGQTLALYDKNTTRANSETALYLWMAHTISPRHRMVEQKLNEQLLYQYDPSLFVAFDECVPENRDFELQERKVNIETGFMTINELREAKGLDPVAWGDEPPVKYAAPAPDVPDDEQDVNDPPVKAVKKKTFDQTGALRDGTLI